YQDNGTGGYMVDAATSTNTGGRTRRPRAPVDDAGDPVPNGRSRGSPPRGAQIMRPGDGRYHRISLTPVPSAPASGGQHAASPARWAVPASGRVEGVDQLLHPERLAQVHHRFGQFGKLSGGVTGYQ